MAKVAITTEKAPKPAANYSPAVRKGPILQLAGQVPFDPETGEIVGSTIAEQTRQVFANLEAVLTEAGSGWQDVVMVRAYLTDTAHFGEFNEVYNELMREPYPARTTVYVGLPKGVLVEIDLLAVVD
ncbi:RidA family protein [Amycolatopsis granulosa]|uniref:RidA family protein n=1 Tax=Amycolatopsis granulosa TaxID=185684 RepID=UPI00141FF95D|nr:Rid family detoxifying hydrolase [Amycolatopsis granulosa]NIH84137.1 reactive intermediate/imine deaminase [Amycolatopsis granulosa]